VWGVTVSAQGAAIDGHPVPYDIFCLVQYLLGIKAKFIPLVNCGSLIKQNGNYQQAYFRRSQGAWNHIATHFTKILIITALEITVSRISTGGESVLFQKRSSLQSFLLGLLFFTGKSYAK